jgi:hypothetical protein
VLLGASRIKRIFFSPQKQENYSAENPGEKKTFYHKGTNYLEQGTQKEESICNILEPEQ